MTAIIRHPIANANDSNDNETETETGAYSLEITNVLNVSKILLPPHHNQCNHLSKHTSRISIIY